MLSENRGYLRPDFSNFKKSEETALENSLLFTFTFICFEDSFTCGCDTTDSVRYHLRANKIDLSLTSVASRVTITFLPARRTLTLEEFKYAFESWRQTTARAGVAFLQLVHCNA